MTRPAPLYLSDMRLQDDERNRARHEAFAAKCGVYRVFETGDGAVCRHREPSRIRGLLTGFEQVADREVQVRAMNGHPAHITQFLARKTSAR